MEEPLNRPDTLREIEKYPGWMYEFDLGDGKKTKTYAKTLQPVHEVRKSMIFEFLDGTGYDYAGSSVVDMACNEGFFLFEMLERGAEYGLGMDIRPDNIEKANLLKRHWGLSHCDFEVGDVFEYDFGETAFDVVFLLGILYHVENPVGLMRLAANCTSRYLFVETQLCVSGDPIPYGWGSPDAHRDGTEYCVLHQEKDWESNPLASVGGFSFIPNLAAVVAMLGAAGFSSIAQLHPNRRVREPQYDNVDRVVLVGIR